MSVIIISKTPCKTCGKHKRYRRSGRCVACVAQINLKHRDVVIPMDRRSIERVQMSGVRYTDEPRVFI